MSERTLGRATALMEHRDRYEAARLLQAWLEEAYAEGYNAATLQAARDGWSTA